VQTGRFPEKSPIAAAARTQPDSPRLPVHDTKTEGAGLLYPNEDARLMAFQLGDALLRPTTTVDQICDRESIRSRKRSK
jgi:hypothetical protein